MESVALVAPVTALEFAGDVLLAGTGPEVAAFLLSGGGTATAAGRRSVLREASVLGLRAEPGGGVGGSALRVAAFGGRWLAVLAVRRGPGGTGGSPRLAACGGGGARQLGERVWEARWAPGGRLALALGGGAVALYEWRGGGRWLRRARCGGAGALRCAVLAGTGWGRLALAAGTATGSVVLWRAAEAEEPRRRLRGHRGAVLALSYAAPRGLLASASEDRSVRLWAVGELGGSGEAACLLLCYGHGARVAAVALRGPSPVSAGEDGACLEWGGGGGVRRARRGHRGALRALALRPAGGSLATGGSDGGARLWRPRRDTPSPVAVALGAPGRPRAVRLAGPHRVLALGEAGGLELYEEAAGRWVPLLGPAATPGPRGVLAVIPLPGGSDTLCALAGGHGHLLVFALDQPEHAARLRLFEGAVMGLSWAPRPRLPLVTALLASGPHGEMLWLDVTCCPGRAPSVRLMGRYRLPPCRQRWHTCAAFLPLGGLLVCGDRRGSLLLFPCGSSPGTDTENNSTADRGSSVGEDSESESEPSCLSHDGTLPLEEPLSVLFGLHGKAGVTSVSCHKDYIYSTGRDGCYRQLRLQGRRLEVLWKHRPCKGLQWIEELRFTPGGDLLVLGFHADNFVVWSTRTGENLHCIPCGGGHRSWSYCSSPSAKTFAYIKSGDVMLYSSEAEPCEQQVLLESLHGREIACVRRLGAVRAPGCHPVNVFITGSEDTTACVLTLSEQSRAAMPLARLSDHISSVRALALASPAQPDAAGLSALLFSAGGRAQIECYRLLCSADTASESAVSCQVVHVASHRLDEHWDRMKNRHKLVKMDPETRAASNAGLGLCCDPCPLGQRVWSKCCVFAQVHVPLPCAWDHHGAAAGTLQVPGRRVQRRIRAALCAAGGRPEAAARGGVVSPPALRAEGGGVPAHTGRRGEETPPVQCCNRWQCRLLGHHRPYQGYRGCPAARRRGDAAPGPGHPSAHRHGSQLRRQQPPRPRAARGTLPGGQRQRRWLHPRLPAGGGAEPRRGCARALPACPGAGLQALRPRRPRNGDQGAAAGPAALRLRGPVPEPVAPALGRPGGAEHLLLPRARPGRAGLLGGGGGRGGAALVLRALRARPGAPALCHPWAAHGEMMPGKRGAHSKSCSPAVTRVFCHLSPCPSLELGGLSPSGQHSLTWGQLWPGPDSSQALKEEQGHQDRPCPGECELSFLLPW